MIALRQTAESSGDYRDGRPRRIRGTSCGDHHDGGPRLSIFFDYLVKIQLGAEYYVHGFAWYCWRFACKLHKGQATYGAEPSVYDNPFVKILI